MLLAAEVCDGKPEHRCVQTKPWKLALIRYLPLDIRVVESWVGFNVLLTKIVEDVVVAFPEIDLLLVGVHLHKAVMIF